MHWCMYSFFLGSGVYFGQLDFNPLDSCENITAETKLLQYPNLTNLPNMPFYIHAWSDSITNLSTVG